MKKNKRMILIVLALIATLLLTTGSATARQRVTRFKATAYVCEMDDPFVQWEDGSVLHQRGVILRSQIVSDLPRMNGVNIDLAHQELDPQTFAVKQAWGTGTIVTGEEKDGTFVPGEGTWYTSWTAKPTDEGLLASRAVGYGRDGLEGQFFYWEGRQVADPEPPEGCPLGLELTVTGFIRECWTCKAMDGAMDEWPDLDVD
jgi:hypothetical protein